MTERENKKLLCYCMSLRQAAGALTDYYNHHLKPDGISINQFSLISNLKEIQPASTSALAQKMNLDRSTLSRNIKSLLEMGLIADSASITNRNHKYVITEKGLQKQKSASLRWKKAQEYIEKHIGKDDLDKFFKTAHDLLKL